MKSNKVTIVLTVVFFLLLVTVVLLYLGVIRLPNTTSFAPDKKTVTSIVNNTPVAKNLIKREANTTYDAAMKDGDTYFQGSHYQDALEDYTQASQLEKTRWEPYEKIGESYYYLGDTDRASENFNFVLEKNPAFESAKIFLAKTDVKKSDFKNALDLFLSLNAENQEIRYYIGILRAEQGDMEKALNNLQKANALNPQTLIGQRAQNTINNIQEFNLFSEGKNIHLKTLVARSLLQNEEYQIAISLLKDVLKENKNYRDAWVLLGFCYYLIDKPEMALETLNNAYDLDPEKAETQYFLGLTYAKLNNAEKAMTFLLLAMKNGFEPRSDIQKRLADLYITEQNYDEALATYLGIIQAGEANDINLYVRPIWIYIDIKKQPAESLPLAKQAMEKYPNSAMGFNLVGWTALANDDLVTAETNLSEALKRDPNLQAAYLNMGDLLFKKGEKEKAKEFYKKAYFIDKSSSIGNLAASKYNTLQSQ